MYDSLLYELSKASFYTVIFRLGIPKLLLRVRVDFIYAVYP